VKESSPFANLRLCEIYPLGRLKLYYWFDFGDDWIFEVRNNRGAHPAEPRVSYPRVVERQGPDPEQYPSGRRIKWANVARLL